jgi:2-iminobutanoate/2-iminopropanoate deaminase
MTQRRAIATDAAPAAIGPYSQAIYDERTGLLFCSGQIGLDPATGQLVPGGVVEEFRRAMRNVEGVLKGAGLGLGDVMRVTLYLADMADFVPVNQAYAPFFVEPFPARATVQAAGLPKGARVEIEVTAVRK